MISGLASGEWNLQKVAITPAYNVLNSNDPIYKYYVTKLKDYTYDGRNIVKGSSKITTIKYGSKEVKEVYVGDLCVYKYDPNIVTVTGSSYIAAHLFVSQNHTLYLSTQIDDMFSAAAVTGKPMIYEGFYINPSLVNPDSGNVEVTLSNFTVDVWIGDTKLNKLNYQKYQLFYNENPDNIIGVYSRSGDHSLSTLINDTTDFNTVVRQGCLLFLNLNQFDLNEPLPSQSPNNPELNPTLKPLYRIRVSNTIDSLVLSVTSGRKYTTYE